MKPNLLYSHSYLAYKRTPGLRIPEGIVKLPTYLLHYKIFTYFIHPVTPHISVHQDKGACTQADPFCI